MALRLHHLSIPLNLLARLIMLQLGYLEVLVGLCTRIIVTGRYIPHYRRISLYMVKICPMVPNTITIPNNSKVAKIGACHDLTHISPAVGDLDLCWIMSSLACKVVVGL